VKGRIVRWNGKRWRVIDVLPYGSLVVQRPWWLPSWWPFGWVMTAPPEQVLNTG
jgi:hypothetical protein